MPWYECDSILVCLETFNFDWQHKMPISFWISPCARINDSLLQFQHEFVLMELFVLVFWILTFSISQGKCSLRDGYLWDVLVGCHWHEAHVDAGRDGTQLCAQSCTRHWRPLLVWWGLAVNANWEGSKLWWIACCFYLWMHGLVVFVHECCAGASCG